jgi:hypothetical protein
MGLLGPEYCLDNLKNGFHPLVGLVLGTLLIAVSDEELPHV